MAEYYYISEEDKLFWRSHDDVGDVFSETHIEVCEHDEIHTFETYEELMGEFPNCAIGSWVKRRDLFSSARRTYV